MLSNKKRHNWLLKTAGIFLCQFFLIIILGSLISSSNIYSSFTESRTSNLGVISSDTHRWILLFYIILFGPVAEELSERSFLTEKKWLKYIGLALFIIKSFTLNSQGIVANSIYSILVCAVFFPEFFKLQRVFTFKLRIIVSALVFALGHFNITTLTPIALYLAISYYVALAFLLSWIVINFSLWKAMIAHIAFNTLVTFGINDLPLTDQEIHTKKLPAYNATITWQEKGLFNNEENTGTNPNNSFIIHNSFPYYMGNIFFHKSEEFKNYLPTNGMVKYDITIEADTIVTAETFGDILTEVGIFTKRKYTKVN